MSDILTLGGTKVLKTSSGLKCVRDTFITIPKPPTPERMAEILERIDKDDDYIDELTPDEFFFVFEDQRASDTRRLSTVQYDADGFPVVLT